MVPLGVGGGADCGRRAWLTGVQARRKRRLRNVYLVVLTRRPLHGIAIGHVLLPPLPPLTCPISSGGGPTGSGGRRARQLTNAVGIVNELSEPRYCASCGAEGFLLGFPCLTPEWSDVWVGVLL